MSTYNSITSQNQSLFVGPFNSTGFNFVEDDLITKVNDPDLTNLVGNIYRLQGANWTFNTNKSRPNTLGKLSQSKFQLDSPDVVLNYSYLLANFHNEHRIGFTVDSSVSCLSGILTDNSDDRNYYIRYSDQGRDVVNNETTGDYVVGIGNCYITNYQSEARVGSLPVASVEVIGENVKYDFGTKNNIAPAIEFTDDTLTPALYSIPTARENPDTGDLNISSLAPGDIEFNISNYNEPGIQVDDTKIQGYTISLGLNRQKIRGFPSRYNHSKEVNYPVNLQLSVDAIVDDYDTGSFHNLIECGKEYDVSIILHKPPDCNNFQLLSNRKAIARYDLKKIELDSFQENANLNSPKSATFNFSTQIGSIDETDRGLFMSGLHVTSEVDFDLLAINSLLLIEDDSTNLKVKTVRSQTL